MANTASAATCTESMGDVDARQRHCAYFDEPSMWTNVQYPRWTYTHSYGSGTWGPPGVETFEPTRASPTSFKTTAEPWCTGSAVPSSAMVLTGTILRESLVTYQIVVTVGEEKLSVATGTGSGTGR
jgi:hypothetical protein